MANLKAMFEKKPAENPFPMKKPPGTAPGGAAKAPPKEEKKVEQIEPQSVSNLKSVFGFEKKTEPAGPTTKSTPAPVKEVNPFAPKKPVEETKAPSGGAFPWNKKPTEDKPQASTNANTDNKPANNPWKKDPVEPVKPPAAEVQPTKPIV